MNNSNAKKNLSFGGKRFWLVSELHPRILSMDDYQFSGIVSLPFIDLPDMTNVQINTMGDLHRFLNNTNVYYSKEDIGSIFNFVKIVKEGDVIVLQTGKELSLIGYAVSGYKYDANEFLPHRIDVGWSYCHIGSDDFDVHISVPGSDLCVSEITDDRIKYKLLLTFTELLSYSYN